MPRNGSNSNSNLNKTPESIKLNPWLVKRFADLALPLAARSTIGFTMSPLTLDSGQRHLSDGNSRLARRVMNHASLTIAGWRAARLPLASVVSDFILRKPTSVPNVWQRVLSLPWVHHFQKQRRGSTQSAYAATDWQQTDDTSRRLQDLQSAREVQMSHANEEVHLVNETAEFYPPAKKEFLSFMTTDILTPPVMMKEPLGTTEKLHRPSGAIAMPPEIRQVVDRPYLNELTIAARITKETPPVSSAKERYPVISKSLLSTLTSADRLTHTTYEPTYYEHTRRIPLITRQIADQQNADHSQIKRAQERQTRVGWQGQHSYQTQQLSQVLTPITQPAILQHRLLETHPETISESIIERQASLIQPSYQLKAIRSEGEPSSVTAELGAMPLASSMPKTQSLYESAADTGDTLPNPTYSKRVATLRSKALSDLPRSLSEPTIANEISTEFDRSAMQRTVDEAGGTALGSLPSRELIPQEDSRVLSYRVTQQPVVGEGKVSMSQPVISRSTEEVLRKAGTRYTTEDVVSPTPTPEVLTSDTEVGNGVNLVFAEGYAEKVLSYKHPLSLASPVIKPPNMIQSISHTMTMPSQQLSKMASNRLISDKSEGYGFLQSHEYVPSSLDYRYTRQPSLAVPVTSPVRSEADSNITYGEQLFRHTLSAIPELTHSRNHNGLDLALASVSRAPETQAGAQATAAEPQVEKSGGEKTTPDLRALAREIYPLIKRMIMIERDRNPTWY